MKKRNTYLLVLFLSLQLANDNAAVESTVDGLKSGIPHGIYGRKKETDVKIHYEKGLLQLLSNFTETFPMITAVFDGTRPYIQNAFTNWDIRLSWELQLQTTIFIYEDNFQYFQNHIQEISIKSREIYFLMHVSMENFVSILKQLKLKRMESKKLKWIFWTSHINVTDLKNRIPVGFEIMLIEMKPDARYYLSKLIIYNDSSFQDSSRTFGLEKIATWVESTNPQNAVRITVFPNSGRINLQGRTLVSAAVYDDPFFILPDADGKGPSLSGIDWSVTKALAQIFNFTSKIVTPSDLGWGGPQPDGTVTGMIGMVARDEADLAIDEITITADREKVVDFCYPYYFEPLRTITLAPKQTSKTWAVFSPFSKEVWLCFIAEIVTCSFGLWLLHSYLIFNQEGERNEFTLTEFLLYILQTTFTQSIPLACNSLSLRIILAAIFLVVLVFRALYGGNLTAALFTPAYDKPIDSLEDLVNTPSLVSLVVNGTSNYYLYQSATSGVYKRIFDSLKPEESYVKDNDDMLRKSLLHILKPVTGVLLTSIGCCCTTLMAYFLTQLQQGHYASFLGVTTGQLKTRGNESKYYFSRETFYPQFYGIAMRRGSELVNAFTLPLLWFREAGLVDKWRTDQLGSTSGANVRLRSEERLSLNHLQGAFLILFFGMSLASISFALEILSKRVSLREKLSCRENIK